MGVDFSVIIPSRNRPEMLRRAIESVLGQNHPGKEVIVVDDGTDGDNAVLLRRMEEELAGRVRFFHLIRRPSGHGQSYALNFGADQAAGEYLCFLDDDDYWIDCDHLSRAHKVIASGGADVYFTNQEAVLNGEKVNRTIWIEDMPAVARNGLQADVHGAYGVTPADLLLCTGFCHLNTTIARKSLFDGIGGLDENIRYECDRDFYLRLIDRARTIKFHPAVTSRHHIPDPAKSTNMSTLVNDLQKRLFQLTVLDKSALFAMDPAIRTHCRKHKVYALKKIASTLRKNGKYKAGSYYSREAILIGFSVKWLLFTAFLTARGVISAE
jgi:glycosyltransferase involved in cell wall biosynthesis